MRINPSRRPPSYQSRRFQFRLILMVGAFALVLVGIEVVRNPRLWDFMARRDGNARPETRKPIDFGIRDDEETPLRPGEFRSRAKFSRPDPDEPAFAEAPGEPAAPPATSGDGGPSTEIERRWLTAIRDSTIGVRRDESDAFYAILARTKAVPQSRLERDSLGNTSFRVLMNDSESLRGRLVTIHGEVKRLAPLTPADNDFDITRLHEAWLVTRDDPANPIRIVFTDAPEGLPQGQAIEQIVPVTVTGYFFKREGYASEGGMHIAPLILAKRLKPGRLTPHPEAIPIPPYLGTAIVGVALSLAAVFGGTVWWLSRGDKSFRQEHLVRLRNERSNAGAATLNQLVAVDPMDVLRELEAEERRAETEMTDNERSEG